MNKNKVLLNQYNLKNITIAVLGSHSALEVCRGAKEEGFSTLVVCQTGREKTYNDIYRTRKSFGCVDMCIILPSFADLLKKDIQHELVKRHAIFIPHRSFEVYLNFDYDSIENNFFVPLFGNRYLLKIEERGTRPNQYDLLEKAGIRYPRIYNDPKDIDRLCMVKVLEKKRGFERAFFLVENYQNYKQQVEKKVKDGMFTRKQLKESVIEEFIAGVHVNFNFFYSPLNKRLELLGTDMRRQTNLEGIIRIPIPYQENVLKRVGIKYEEAGHIAVTVLESILEKVYEIGERFVKASKKMYPPGIIGPFALQSFIIPGPPKKEIVVVDVSPRVPGSPGISATPYSQYLFGKQVSVGRRIAMEIKDVVKNNCIEKVVT